MKKKHKCISTQRAQSSCQSDLCDSPDFAGVIQRVKMRTQLTQILEIHTLPLVDAPKRGICDGADRTHTGKQWVNESLWTQLVPSFYTCSRCQVRKRELKGGDRPISELLRTESKAQLLLKWKKPGCSLGTDIVCWLDEPPSGRADQTQRHRLKYRLFEDRA